LLLFKKSAAISATEDTTLKAMSDGAVGMIQTVVDNFDADIASQNGKVSTHSVAMLMTQSVTTSTEETRSDTFKRIP